MTYQFKRPRRDETPWGRVRAELSGKPLRRHRPSEQRFHPMHCGCAACRCSRDPASGRNRKVAQAQAGVLLAFLVLIYGLLLFFAPAIAGSFGWGLSW